MLDLKDLVTTNGSKVIVHFEAPHLHKDLDEAYSQDDFMKKLDNAISNPKFGSLGAGPGATIHMLINIYGDATYLPDKEYVKWKKNPGWFHEESRRASAPYILIGVSHQGENNRFKGPPYDQAEKYLADPMIAQISEKASREGNCPICITPADYCPFRRASFDPAALKVAIKAAKASI